MGAEGVVVWVHQASLEATVMTWTTMVMPHLRIHRPMKPEVMRRKMLRRFGLVRATDFHLVVTIILKVFFSSLLLTFISCTNPAAEHSTPSWQSCSMYGAAL